MRLDLIPSGRFASSLSCHSTMSIHVAGLVVSFLKQTHLPASIVSGSTAPPTDAIHSSPPSRPPVCWPFKLRPHFPSSSSHRAEMDTSLFSHSHHDDVSAPPHVLAQPSIIYRPTPLLWFLIKKREIDYTGWMRSATRPEIRNHHNRSLGASEQPHLTSPHLTAQYVWPPVHSSSESSSNWICLRHREESSPQEESNSFAVLYWYGMVWYRHMIYGSRFFLTFPPQQIFSYLFGYHLPPAPLTTFRIHDVFASGGAVLVSPEHWTLQISCFVTAQAGQ